MQLNEKYERCDMCFRIVDVEFQTRGICHTCIEDRHLTSCSMCGEIFHTSSIPPEHDYTCILCREKEAAPQKSHCSRCAEAYVVEPGKKVTWLCDLCIREIERRNGSTLVNEFMGVISEGKLIPQTWPNPESDFDRSMEALDRAEGLRQYGRTSYAVLVKEMTRESMAKFKAAPPATPSPAELRLRGIKYAFELKGKVWDIPRGSEEYSRGLNEGCEIYDTMQAALSDESKITEEIDSIVHDVVSEEASGINNGGLNSQVQFLIDSEVPVEDILAALRCK